MELIIEISNLLKDNPLVYEIFMAKLFPKAYDSKYLFTETENYSKIQFYSN